jgi:multicomponent K+:H+ antiporter subunit G
MLAEAVISALLVIGAAFSLIGSIALVRLPDAMQRLHGPTKATTLGVGGILLASMLYLYAYKSIFSFHEILIGVFLMLTAPISAHLLAKAHLHISKSRRD